MLDSLRKMENEFKRMLVETFDEHFDPGLYTLKYYLLDHSVDDIQTFGALSVLDSSPCEHSNLHTKQAYKKTFCRTDEHE